eukprot:gene11849-5178_t
MNQGKKSQSGNSTKIGDLSPNMNKLNCVFIVLEKTPPAKTKQNIIHHYLVADETAAIQLSLWDNHGEGVQIGEIFQLKNGCCRVWSNVIELQKGKIGEIERIGEFTMIFNEAKNLSNFEWEEDKATKTWTNKGLKQQFKINQNSRKNSLK